MIHKLKTWPQFFRRVFEGTKKFELRKDDRHFEINDTLSLQEWDPEKQEYTGRQCLVIVTYILRGGNFGLEEGYVIMSIELKSI